MPLVSLVYVSYASRPMTDAELRDLLHVCRENNRKLQLTGMLLYRSGFFIQALEGEENVVDSLYAKIKDDPRHHHVVTVCKDSIHKRTFGQWEMGFNKVSDAVWSQLDGYSPFLQEPVPSYFTQYPDRAHKLLASFHDQIYF